MNIELQLKLQSYLDGELAEPETREVLAWIEQDSEAAALLAELTNTRTAIQAGEPNPGLPESREFHWSKIRREIERQEQASARAETTPWFRGLLRYLVPATSVAVLLLVGFLVAHQRTEASLATSYELESEVTGADAFTYVDEEEGTTLIWFSYPIENEFPNGEETGIL